MKQVLIISGKGGTGKTVVAGAFAALAGNKVIADCDVDAADLHLLMNPGIVESHEFRSGKTAVIDGDKCTGCGKCAEVCRFEAVGEGFVADPVSCQGCGFCALACPEGAITMEENVSGRWFISETRFGPMVHAKLGIAEENSGKLVSLVKKKAAELAEKEKSDWVIVDGAPGTGCPVIASLSGIDRAVVVTEPTLSGLHDAKRVLEVAGHFNVPAELVINKYDLNIDMSSRIEEYCAGAGINLLGRIPFDKSVVESIVAGKTLIERGSPAVREKLSGIWEKLAGSLG